MRRRGLLSAALVAGLVLVGGCAGSSDAGDGASTSPGASKEDDAQRRNLTRSVRTVVGDQVLEATVHPVERVDDHTVLTIDYSVPEDSGSDSEVDVQDYMEQCILCGGTSTVRLVDLPGGSVWTAGYAAAEGHDPISLTKQSYLSVAPGKTATSVTFFGQVDADTVDVMIPFVGLVTGVPVVDGDADTPGLDSLGLDNKLPGTGYYDKEESAPVYPGPLALQSSVRAYDNSASTKTQGTKQTVIMASDVLFDTDVAELSDAASARVDDVASQIAQVASGGEVHVVGHTDDVDTVEYNLDLSRRRATSVADRLTGVLGSAFTVTKEGRGKSEPAIEGTDAAARAANRRVEIEFTATEAVTLSHEGIEIPPATGSTSSGHDPVTYSDGYSGHTTLSTKVSSVVRHDGYLVGTVEVSNISSGMPMYNLVCRGGAFESLDGSCLTLMGPNGYVLPLQHASAANLENLTDGNHYAFLYADSTVTYTIVWPDTGQGSVTIDSPGMFRITDVPVENP